MLKLATYCAVVCLLIACGKDQKTEEKTPTNPLKEVNKGPKVHTQSMPDSLRKDTLKTDVNGFSLDSLNQRLNATVQANYQQLDFVYQDEELYIQWGNLFDPNKRHAVVVHYEQDDQVWNGLYTLKIYDKTPTGLQEQLVMNNIQYSTAAVRKPAERVQYVDMNGDNVKDLKILAAEDLAGGYSDLVLYKKSTGKFKWVEGARTYANVSPVPYTNRVKSVAAKGTGQIRQELMWRGGDVLQVHKSAFVDYGPDSLVVQYSYQQGKLIKADTLWLKYPYVRRKYPRQ